MYKYRKRQEQLCQIKIGDNIRSEKRSPLCMLTEFDITAQLVQDVMYILLEDSVQYELRHCLVKLFAEHNLTITDLNSCILTFELGYSEQSDSFSQINENVFTQESYKLKLNAAQSRLLLRIIPFLLYPFVDENHEVLKFIAEMSNIVNILFSPVVSEQTLRDLREKIERHLKQFKELFPEQNIIPKQHYTIHMPTMIKKLGPLIRYSCFNFESAHKYFKEIAKKTKL